MENRLQLLAAKYRRYQTIRLWLDKLWPCGCIIPYQKNPLHRVSDWLHGKQNKIKWQMFCHGFTLKNGRWISDPDDTFAWIDPNDPVE
jgi:hypothetical protein